MSERELTHGARPAAAPIAAGASRPRVLGFDTATELCSVALLRDDEVIELSEPAGRGAGERILVMVDAVLRAGATSLRELDAIAFGRGPGSFTGVRLAAGVAQGLAFGANRPVVPVSDLQALAERGFAIERGATHVLACADARMREVYWAVFGRDADGGAVALGPERVGAPAAVDPWRADGGLPPNAPGPVVAVGTGFAAHPMLGERFGSRLAAIHATLLPQAREIAVIAAREWLAGRTLPAAMALPVYVRDEVARPRSSG